jgi:hypothetical protein
MASPNANTQEILLPSRGIAGPGPDLPPKLRCLNPAAGAIGLSRTTVNLSVGRGTRAVEAERGPRGVGISERERGCIHCYRQPIPQVGGSLDHVSRARNAHYNRSEESVGGAGWPGQDHVLRRDGQESHGARTEPTALVTSTE